MKLLANVSYKVKLEDTSKRKDKPNMKNSKVISILNNKGGVAKTTSTGVLAQIFAYLGKKVLVVDLDGQANTSAIFNNFRIDSQDVIDGIELPDKFNVTELFKYRYRTKEEVEAIIVPTQIKGVDLIPSSERYNNVNVIVTMNTGNNYLILKRALETVKNEYDYILLDNAPANNILTVNSLFASDMVIVPVQVEQFSYIGLTQTLNMIAYIKEEHGIDYPEIAGIFLTLVEKKTNQYKKYEQKYREEFRCQFFETSIRKDIKMKEAIDSIQPILAKCPDSRALEDYAALILEMNILDKEAKELLIQSFAFGEVAANE